MGPEISRSEYFFDFVIIGDMNFTSRHKPKQNLSLINGPFDGGWIGGNFIC